MMEATGEILKATGKRILIVAEGPTPGRTPISVPIKTPTKQNRRFTG
jgi:hypothetical protein